MKKRIRKGWIMAFVCLCMLGLTGCGDLVSEPNEGDLVAPVLNTTALTEVQKLLETGMCVAVDNTLPSRWGYQTGLEINGMEVDGYYRQDEIHLESNNYSKLEGIVTFRGDNYRSGAAFGVAKMSKYAFDEAWSIKTGSLKKTVSKGNWTGSGWTGQPLIVRWNEATKQAMNIYDSKKKKTDLTEVIYPTMDGNIYFLDLEDGTATRDKISLGFPIKGTGSLYPDGTPLYVVGAGDDMGDDSARLFFVDLLQGKVIYEFGYDDAFALREDNGKFCAFDSSALFDPQTDTLIQPGENGILYTMKLNTKYDGRTLSIDPSEVVKWRYTNDRVTNGARWLGIESSAVIYDHYWYASTNSGELLCIDLNTMELVWTQDVSDDSNGSPVLDVDTSDGTAYIYISASLHWTKDKKDSGEVPIYKINAATGEVVWKRTYECKTVDGVSGGVQATAALGQNNLSDLVYFNVARTGGKKHGKLVAIYKETGGEAWSVDLKHYSWSSPVAVYDAEGNGYIILCESDGNMHLLDGRTGELKDTISLGKNVEASPAVFENTIVVGTRGKKIFGITLK